MTDDPESARAPVHLEGEAFSIHLPTFDGPLDLLLHLIRKEELDIFDIPISRLTTAYLGYLEAMRRLAIEPASEFLVMAATLMQRVKFSSTASPLWDGSVLNGNVCGFPGMSSAQVSSGHLVFGDWSQVIMAEWGSLAIEVNPYANFQAGIVGIRGMYAMDVGVRIPSAFAVSTAVT